jgi:D-beta-D-heptose 7-phosphate kinase / D-beta-D-heptose 1-phosphate adenosyltransferase
MTPSIPDFRRADVLVVGDVMLDRYWYGDTSRISPEAPVPVVHVGDTQERPGGAGNVALNIAALGARVSVAGLIGTDEVGRALQGLLAQAGVECLLEAVPGFATITKLRVLSRHQQLIRLDFEDGFGGTDPAALTDRIRPQLERAQVLVLSDYGKGSLRRVQELIGLARAAGIPALVDPKGSDFERYRGATLITPNLGEFEAVVGRCADEAELVARGERLLRELELEYLLVTRGEHGMTLLGHERAPLHLPARAREVYDVTGAGDTVISVLATALAVGQPLAAACALANLAAGIVVGRLGAVSVSAEELETALHEQAEVHHGVMGEADLLTQLAAARGRGERVVMTNGCFDILHPGHVAYLEQARALGDRLVVAVNDDDSVRRLKGAGRPVNGLADRMAVLAGLRSVDWVVPFAEDTPERLICRVLPDLLVKGGDYRAEEVAGGECVRAAGGEVVILDFVEGRSTSGIIRSIRER